MRHFDFAPLYRSTVGFDRLFSLLDQGNGLDQSAPSYPPYNIERTVRERLSRQRRRRRLHRQGHFHRGEGEWPDHPRREAGDKAEKQSEVLHQGIAARAFERRFQLADYVQVTGASLEHGLLHVDLVREIPEAKKPRLVPITTSAAPQVEVQKAA